MDPQQNRIQGILLAFEKIAQNHPTRIPIPKGRGWEDMERNLQDAVLRENERIRQANTNRQTAKNVRANESLRRTYAAAQSKYKSWFPNWLVPKRTDVDTTYTPGIGKRSFDPTSDLYTNKALPPAANFRENLTRKEMIDTITSKIQGAE